jgi:hypothetical protein
MRDLAGQYFPDGVNALPDNPKRRELDQQLLVQENDLRELLYGPFMRAAEQAGWSHQTVGNRFAELQYWLTVAIRWCNGVDYTVRNGPDGVPRVEYQRVPYAVGDARVILPKLFGEVDTALERVIALAIPDAVPAPSGVSQPTNAPAADPATQVDQYVTLGQAAALVNRGKKTLERRMNIPRAGMPPPDIEGGGGKPHEWRWPALRPWLEKEFGRCLPERFPPRANGH